MRLVIDIPDEVKCKVHDYGLSLSPNDKEQLINAITHGTPLPKEHGKLVILSVDKLKENQMDLSFSCQKWISEVGLSFATVAIIEVDKEIEE